MSSIVEIRLLQAAIALADELNFGKAAERLHITQSALTKQIHELESLLPLTLFERDKKHVSILHPGEVFVEEARLAVMHGERAVFLAKAAACEELRTVVIGRSPCTDCHLVESLFAVTLPLFPTLHISNAQESGSPPNRRAFVRQSLCLLSRGLG